MDPTTEDQAIDRAHRIGQTHPVIVTRITIKDTVEDRILSLQVFSFYRLCYDLELSPTKDVNVIYVDNCNI